MKKQDKLMTARSYHSSSIVADSLHIELLFFFVCQDGLGSLWRFHIGGRCSTVREARGEHLVLMLGLHLGQFTNVLD